MKWHIPAKTFLLGEYAAIADASAILLTTTPYFELSLTDEDKLDGIHYDSPAGIWWQQSKRSGKGLTWYDPYDGIGGLGASSAQFLACYLTSCELNQIQPDLNTMLNAYYQSSWTGTGLRPSGYDVIAQSQQGCVYINKKNKMLKSYDWPFKDLSFLLLHTGVKLATHHHLKETSLPLQIDHLSSIVDEAKHAFEQADSGKLVDSINRYHQTLSELNLVAQHSLEFIHTLKSYPEVLAIKGCGALGADILLLITAPHDAPALKNKLLSQKWTILASEAQVTKINKNSLLSNSL